MKDFKRKLAFFIRCLRHIKQPKICPYCHSNLYSRVDSKFFVTELLKCCVCNLNYRHPKDSENYLEEFYEKKYDMGERIETKLPSKKELRELMDTNFPIQRDYSDYCLALCKNVNSRIIDYGCSWGYTVFQLKKTGFDVQGFEISKFRAQFANKLGVVVQSEISNLRVDNDLIFSSHVMEHLADIKRYIELSGSFLKEEGIFMAFCPNGSNEYQQRDPLVYKGSWGDIHVNAIDIEFAMYAFQKNPYIILTGDWKFDLQLLSEWNGQSQVVGEQKDGKELLIISKPNLSC